MKKLLLLFLCTSLFSSEINHIRTLYHRIDQKSIFKLLAFHELYPQTPEGKQAQKKAWKLLNQKENISLQLPNIDLYFIHGLIHKKENIETPQLSEDQLTLIEKLGSNLANRKLKGHTIWDEASTLTLTPNEIDLSRGLFLSEFGSKNQKNIRSYEASLDLMALEIAAHLSPRATDLEKIEAINDFIFYQMRYRFPPHSLYSKHIDTYTFLPSVMDSRKGVCLGVSILYLCLAQRLDLHLEAVTPPGHIFVRYNPGKIKEINIETTARGINLPTSTFLSLETKTLPVRDIKEVIGCAFMNQASVAWQNDNHAKAIELYEKALPYLPDDPNVREFLGYNYLFIGKKNEGINLLKEALAKKDSFEKSQDTLTQDYLQGKTDQAGIKAVFLHVDETRESILEKQKKLHKVIEKYPSFRAGLLQLASTYLQLGRTKEALVILENYEKVDSKCALIHYYLSAINLERLNYPQAWTHLLETKKILEEISHKPKAIKELELELKRKCPQPY